MALGKLGNSQAYSLGLKATVLDACGHIGQRTLHSPHLRMSRLEVSLWQEWAPLRAPTIPESANVGGQEEKVEPNTFLS